MVLGVVSVMLFSASAQADVFDMGGTRDAATGAWTGMASLDFVPVGNPGNAGEQSSLSTGDTTYYGAVDHTYQIGKYDVTVAQYTTFLNAVAASDPYGLYDSGMSNGYVACGISRSGSSGSYSYSATKNGNFPVNYVSWADAARFCNWLQNGQPAAPEGTGTTETGAYTLNGATSDSALIAVTRDSAATYFVPTENEWYKAAYYRGGSINAGYWAYPTRSNTVPSNVLSATGPNNANFVVWSGIENAYVRTDPVNILTPVGAFAASSGPYGTFDMGGDVEQLTETPVTSWARAFRGGCFDATSDVMASYYWNGMGSSASGSRYGFRVASVPEPSTLVLFAIAAISLLSCIWRRRRRLHNVSLVVLAAMFVSTAGVAQADVFNMGGTRDPATGTWTGLASLEFVPVGNPGNAADTRHETPGYGAVDYTYSIGKFEVTAGQYTAFLNAVAKTDTYGLYNTYMAIPVNMAGCNIQRTGSTGSYSYSVAADWANRPVNYVSWGDAARFCNWLQNGQPTAAQGTATTEDGAYYLNGTTTDAGLLAIERKAGAKWAIPSENEWYKAAFYKGGSTHAGYWEYPTRSNTLPTRDLNDVSGDNANYYDASYLLVSGNYYKSVVGDFQNSASPYGTFDQGGNVSEWDEAILGPSGESRGVRGGGFSDSYGILSAAATGHFSYPTGESYGTGFRVVGVPEPGSLAMLAAGAIGLLGYVLRRQRA
jgi:formylglycine-generating enzyme required for sulfatase activity